MDNCLEKKIYDRQINKQGLSDRIVDECNPDANLTIKDVANLCWDDVDLTDSKKNFDDFIDKYDDVVMNKVIKECGAVLSKVGIFHCLRKYRRLISDESKKNYHFFALKWCFGA